jgi:DNA-binding transcriptional LysR family regulator
MNDTNLACFLSVARTLNFSTSAKALSMPQQSVSRNIQKLEEELGYTLLSRDSQAVKLTGAGERFYQWCRTFDSKLSAANFAVKRKDPSLGLGWGDWTGCPEGLQRGVRRFQREHSPVELHFTQGTHQEVLQFLLDGIIDLALLPTRCVRFSPRLMIEPPVLSVPLYVLTGQGNPLRTLGSGDPSVLAAMTQLVPPLICGEEGDDRPRPVNDLFPCDVPQGNVEEMPNIDSVYTELLNNTGYAISPINPWVESCAALQPLLPAGGSVELSFVRRQNSQNPWIDILIQLVKEEVG